MLCAKASRHIAISNGQNRYSAYPFLLFLWWNRDSQLLVHCYILCVPARSNCILIYLCFGSERFSSLLINIKQNRVLERAGQGQEQEQVPLSVAVSRQCHTNDEVDTMYFRHRTRQFYHHNHRHPPLFPQPRATREHGEGKREGQTFLGRSGCIAWFGKQAVRRNCSANSLARNNPDVNLVILCTPVSLQMGLYPSNAAEIVLPTCRGNNRTGKGLDWLASSKAGVSPGSVHVGTLGSIECWKEIGQSQLTMSPLLCRVTRAARNSREREREERRAVGSVTSRSTRQTDRQDT